MVCTRRSHLKHIPTDFERREEKRKEREVRMIKRRLGTDIRFRSTKDINRMLATGKLGGKPVKFFIISAHGNISRQKVFRMPSRTAVFDVGENEYRGRLLCSCRTQPLFNTIIGRRGTHMGSFFNAMLGGEYTPDPTSPLIQQIGYRTPGELAFDISLGIVNDVKNNFEYSLGCWDITNTIPTFNPMDFTRYRKGIYMPPNKSRFMENPYVPLYKPEINIRNRMRRKGMYLSKVIQKLERKYPDTVCFISVSCCMGLTSPERLGTEYPEQPSAYTHYALKGEALGEPEVVLDCSMITCRPEEKKKLIEYGMNTSLSMVLRSRSKIHCTRYIDGSSPYTPI